MQTARDRLHVAARGAARLGRTATVVFVAIAGATFEIAMTAEPNAYSAPFRVLFDILMSPLGVLFVTTGAMACTTAIAMGMKPPAPLRLYAALVASGAGALTMTVLASVGTMVLPDPVPGGQSGTVATTAAVVTMLASIFVAKDVYEHACGLIAELFPNLRRGSRSDMHTSAPSNLPYVATATVGVWDARTPQRAEWTEWVDLAMRTATTSSITERLAEAMAPTHGERYIAVMICRHSAIQSSSVAVVTGATSSAVAGELVKALGRYVAGCATQEPDRRATRAKVVFTNWSDDIKVFENAVNESFS